MLKELMTEMSIYNLTILKISGGSLLFSFSFHSPLVPLCPCFLFHGQTRSDAIRIEAENIY